MRYRIFIRNWWKMENGEKVPDPSAKKTTIKTVDSPEDARKWCQQYNELHPAGKLSRKAEWESI